MKDWPKRIDEALMNLRAAETLIAEELKEHIDAKSFGYIQETCASIAAIDSVARSIKNIRGVKISSSATSPPA